jgi:predicted dehydrogenase
MARLGFGLIGTGFMGKAHAIALKAAGTVFPEIEPPVCELLADTSPQGARAAAAALGFRRSTDDWRELVGDPAVHVVDICTPNHLHHEMALAAIAAGKHVYCEKPLALDAAQAEQVTRAAAAAGVRHAIGFNYICNPLVRVARGMVASGELGTIYGFRGAYLEDYMADARVAWTWRCSRELAGAGALADLGSHLIDLAHFLLGDIDRVCATLRTVHAQRLDRASNDSRAVENEDLVDALVVFASGVTGSFEVSRVATGYKCGLTFEVVGSRGTLAYDQERMNELRFYEADDRTGRRGFRTLLAGPEHPDYARFCPAPGHGLGINDLKVIELRNLIQAIADDEPLWADFTEGLRVQRVMAALERSHAEHGWVRVSA